MPEVQAAPAASAALAPAFVGVPQSIVDEARSRLLVWNDEPGDVVERVARKGVPYDVAEALVNDLAKQVRAKLAPDARFAGGVHIVVGLPIALIGGGLLYAYFAARQGGSWRPNTFTGSMLLGGIVMSVLGVVTTLRGIARLVTGSQPPE